MPRACAAATISCHGIHAAERIRYVGDGDQARAGAQQFFELVEQQFAGVIDRRHPEDGAAAFAEHLPRHDVRVVFHVGDQDFIAGRQSLAKRRGNQVDGLGRAAREHDFARRAALMKPRTVSRAPSYMSVARWLSVCTPRCTLA